MTTGTPEQPSPYAVEVALAAALAELANAQDAQIAQAWAGAWSEVSADLLDVLTVILSDVGRVNATAVVRYERFARVLAAIADRLDALATDLGIAITNDLGDVLAQAQTGTVELIAAQRLSRPLPHREVPTAALDAIVRRTTQQVTSTALPLADETYAIVLGELTRGVAAGDNPRQTAARMVSRAEDHMNFGRARAQNIARTETLDAYREGERVTQQAHADLLAGWVWAAHLGSRTCRSCLAMHGQVFDLEVPGPNDHPSGRCGRVPVVREDDGSVDLSWLPSAEEHFAGLSVADQKAILGKDGYRAWAAGDFPMESWTKTRHADGWRDSQVPASPPSKGGAAGGGGDGRPGAPGGDVSDEPPPSYREAALARFGPPPVDVEPWEAREYWAQRQGALPLDFGGDILKPHEVEFVERFLDAGETLEWIPKDPALPTNDFFWTSRDRLPVELKSTKARAATIHGRLVDAMSRAARQGVTKENFIVDLGDQALPDGLIDELVDFNVDRRKYLVAGLWIFAGGRVHAVPLVQP
ncbi:phage minor head protein [Pimelobacter simplex]|uniref:phage minor head protein n=1 Tax=Nocardioides simplex TaxID=2045 RepID=UPI00214F8865|nr:phage minor head protein [Pimelobacter simplex]UUW88459.1 phage minor head protein [Pimelobacter simplex]UUW97963.1 phage minor head protein [Pimelobacter simplex]